MGQRIPGEWRDIGKQCGWTPGQIAIAEVLANETRQALYKKARRFDDPIANHELAQAVDDEQGDKDAVGG